MAKQFKRLSVKAAQKKASVGMKTSYPTPLRGARAGAGTITRLRPITFDPRSTVGREWVMAVNASQ